MPAHRNQRTVRQLTRTSGPGFLTGARVNIEFHPAEPGFGIQFERSDLPGSGRIPATLDYVVPRERRTAISNGNATIELVEHVMAALAGLQIDNCLVRIDGVECPGMDGSSLGFVQALLEAEIIEQSALRELLVVNHESRIGNAEGGVSLVAQPLAKRALAITYELDYGPRSPISPQLLTVEISPEVFVTSLAFARTFVLESEVLALQALGYGKGLSHQDLLIFGPDGVIGNELRAANECVRHKILDCVGDFALLGCDIFGHFKAHRTGHSHNHAIIRATRDAHAAGRAVLPFASGTSLAATSIGAGATSRYAA